ncbi:putative zinc protease YmxG [Xylanibacillus composti]|uniref:Putative zinc protease YmxG n=1 Tax=Xylanibacillus composti TaxID=1572762 RepID=A0A8J4H315_9BACL|nr:pitrilysin family protein [Xylanibacillus composti]GIQ68591.1 putative zinc protease YmxG [Xylanibacillus composti]
MKRYRLSNGIRVVEEPLASFRSVSFGIWVKTGSRNEKPETNGISHFIEHMLFKGTDKYSAKDIAEIFDGIGGNVNAFTAKEYTCYYAKVLDEHLPMAVEVMADMFYRSVYADTEMDKEKNVIYEEIAMYEDTPDDLVHDLVAKAAYGSHALGYPILGTQENLEGFTAADLRKYLQDYYVADEIVISVAGHLVDGMEDLLERHFGSLPLPGAHPPAAKPEFVGETIFHEKPTEQNHICLSFPGCSHNDRDLYAMVLLNNALGGGMSSRLFQEIRESRGMAYSVYSYHSAHTDSGLLTIYIGTAPKQTKKVMDLTLDILGDLRDQGLTENELNKGKEQLKGSLILSLESTGSRMNRLGKNELVTGDHPSLDEMIQRIENVTMDTVQQLAGRILNHPVALSMVGQSDKDISNWRNDCLVLSNSAQKIAGK